jgi:hypothetical protein
MRITIGVGAVLLLAACSSGTKAAPTTEAPTTVAAATTMPPAPITAAGPTLGRDTFLAVKDCLDEMSVGIGSFAVDFSTNDDLNTATEVCGEALDLLDADGISGPIVEAIAYRNVEASFLALKVVGGTATPDDGAEFDAGWPVFYQTTSEELDRLNGK